MIPTRSSFVVKRGVEYWNGKEWSPVKNTARHYAEKPSAENARMQILRFRPALDASIVYVQEML